MPSNELEQVNRIDKDANVHTDSVVITSENGKNQAVDFIEFVQNSNDSSAVKIRNLRQYISDEELLTIYQDKAGTITSEEELGNYLEEIFLLTAGYINELPNGIIIDLKTGLVDIDKSFEQAVKVGIYSKDSIIVDNITAKDVIEALDIKVKSDEKIESILKGFMKYEHFFDDFQNDVQSFLDLNLEESDLPDDLKIYGNKLKDELTKSPYKQHSYAYELNLLLIKLDVVKNTPAHIEVLSEIEAFYRRHPDYAGDNEKIFVLNPDGTINKEAKEDLLKHKEIYNQIVMLKHINMVNGLKKEEFDEIEDEEKHHIILCAFSGLSYENSEEPELRAIARESKKIVEKLYPNIDLTNEKELAKILKNDLRFKGEINAISYEEFIEVAALRLEAITEDDIIKNTDADKSDEIDFSKLDFNSNSRKYLNDPIRNYFVGSKIEFTKDDLNLYNEEYINSTIDSWVEDKDTAIKLRYRALKEVLKEYKEAQSNTYIENKIKEIENSIAEFEEKYADKDLTFDEGDMSFDGYREDFVNAGLTKFLTRDTLSWQKGVDYKDLTPKHKRGYMRNILVCLEKIEEDKKNGFYSPISKLTLRRLELMNSEGREFISFDENGDFKINKELILKEYNKTSSYEYKNFEELQDSAMLRKNEYLLRKLDEYTKLDEKEFLSFGEETDPIKIMNMIEDKRTESNQKRIHDNIERWKKIKKDRDIIENSPYETDMHLFEMCKLHRDLRDPKNVENTQMYSIMLSKIKEFYKKHPEYEEKEIPILNEDGTLNEEEIEKMNQYSEAYQRIIIIKHLEDFEDKSQEEIEKMPQKEKQHILLCAFAGLKYRDSNDAEIQKLSNDCMKIIKQSYPELDLENEEKIAEFFKNEMGFEGNIKNLSLDELVEIVSLQLKEATETYIENDDSTYVGKEIDFSKLDLDSSKRKIYNSVMRNYFVGSEIEFNEKDEDKYNMIYQYFTVSSWLENKDNAIKLRYIALNTIRDEYKNTPNNSYTKKKLEEIENDLAIFENQYGKMDLTENEEDVHFSVYRQQFVNAGLTKYLTRDSSEWSEGVNYADLDNDHKKIYIRNALVALEHKDDTEFCMTKIGLRRLELMNSEGKEFFKVNSDGEYEINEELIVEEYNRMSSHTYSNYNELAQSASLRKNEYVLKKLEEYTKLDAKAYVKLEDKDDYKKSMDQIEKARYVSNQKRIHEMFQESKMLEENELSTDESVRENELNTEEPAGENELNADAKEKKLNIDIEPLTHIPINDDDFESSIETADVERGQIDIANQELPKKERKIREKEQEEVDDRVSDFDSELKNAVVDVAQIDDSAINEVENEKYTEKVTFSDRIKSAFDSVKNFISKHINKKEKQKRLEAGKKVPSDSTATGEIKKTLEKEDFNSSLVVDLSLQEQQEYSKKQQIQNLTDEGKKIDDSEGRY